MLQLALLAALLMAFAPSVTRWVASAGTQVLAGWTGACAPPRGSNGSTRAPSRGSASRRCPTACRWARIARTARWRRRCPCCARHRVAVPPSGRRRDRKRRNASTRAGGCACGPGRARAARPALNHKTPWLTVRPMRRVLVLWSFHVPDVLGDAARVVPVRGRSRGPLACPVRACRRTSSCCLMARAPPS